MLYLLAFYLAQVACSGYAFLRGGAPERAVGGMMIAAALASTLATYLHHGFGQVNPIGLTVDAAFMLGLVAVAVCADRFWPMYVAALHLLGLGIHGVRAFDPAILPVIYARAPAAVAYPMLVLLVLGTSRHIRRKRAGLPEHAWAFQRHN